MKVKFLKDTRVQKKLIVYKGEIFDAVEDEDFIMIHVIRNVKTRTGEYDEDYGTIKAPKSEIDGILEVIE